MGLELAGLIGPPDDDDRAYESSLSSPLTTADDEFWNFEPEEAEPCHPQSS